MIQKYFSFSGRLNRKPYWMFILLVFAVELAILAVFAAVYALSDYSASVFLMIAAGVIVAPVIVAVTIAAISITARRLHDRDKSAWWIIVFYIIPSGLAGLAQWVSGPEPGLNAPGAAIQLVGFMTSIWAFVELGFLKGTNGPNRYGPDPLASE